MSEFEVNEALLDRETALDRLKRQMEIIEAELVLLRALVDEMDATKEALK